MHMYFAFSIKEKLKKTFTDCYEVISVIILNHFFVIVIAI